jgi:hypothetical protein
MVWAHNEQAAHAGAATLAMISGKGGHNVAPDVPQEHSVGQTKEQADDNGNTTVNTITRAAPSVGVLENAYKAEKETYLIRGGAGAHYRQNVGVHTLEMVAKLEELNALQRRTALVNIAMGAAVAAATVPAASSSQRMIAVCIDATFTGTMALINGPPPDKEEDEDAIVPLESRAADLSLVKLQAEDKAKKYAAAAAAAANKRKRDTAAVDATTGAAAGAAAAAASPDADSDTPPRGRARVESGAPPQEPGASQAPSAPQAAAAPRQAARAPAPAPAPEVCVSCGKPPREGAELCARGACKARCCTRARLGFWVRSAQHCCRRHRRERQLSARTRCRRRSAGRACTARWSTFVCTLCAYSAHQSSFLTRVCVCRCVRVCRWRVRCAPLAPPRAPPAASRARQGSVASRDSGTPALRERNGGESK